MKRTLMAVGLVVLAACGSVQHMGDRDQLKNQVLRAVGEKQVAQGGRIDMKIDSIAVTGTEADVVWTESQSDSVIQSRQHYTRSPAGQWLPSGEAVELSRKAATKQAGRL